ncbi:RNA 2',3'-cyclic phosphodiesterase [Methanomassiliicoccus luminyensis]|uniref:RNA 2',3'-cyclic phosphodiesterase n=1 Tax=Methanomassiliicoccus luminyensis TaxID=1080712 RepID=UPI00037365A0|nr:RNA 2',3'-cyclic phosphodiesterase [Methanomassiliicoccus luminyensis]
MTIRAFISVDLAREQRIEDFAAELKNADPTLKVVDPGQIHVTLKFLGDTDEKLVSRLAEAMRDAAQGVGPFTIRFKGVSSFPGRSRIRVIWVGMNDALPMATMAGRLDESLTELGFSREARAFAPHLTVARAKVETSNATLRQIIENHAEDDFGEQRVDRIQLKKSVLTRCGPQYTTLEEIVLNSP